AYADSALEEEAEVVAWRERAAALAQGPAALRAAPLPAPRATAGRALGETIQRRGSTREFSGEPISAADLSSALFHATRGVAADVPSGLVDLYLTVHAVDGVEPGAYAYDAASHGLALLDRGDFRHESAFLCLEQPLGGASAATVFFLADLDHLLARLG